MDDLERLLCEFKSRRWGLRAPPPANPPNQDATSTQDTLTRLAHLEARLRATTPSTPSSLSQGTPSSLGLDPLAPPPDWRLLHRQLTQRGLPPLLDADSSTLPRPEDAYSALCSALAELDRVGRQCDVLRSAAEAAEAREAAALRRAQAEATRRPQEHRELQATAAQAAKEAAIAQEAAAVSRRAAQGATAEAASLRTTANRLQRQLITKDAELSSLQQQLGDLQAHRSRLQAAAQEGLRCIRQALTADRLGLRVPMPPHLTPLQVARAYEGQLRIAEEEARAARAETALLRRRLGCEGSGDDETSREIAKAETEAQKAREEAETWRTEVERRPTPEEHERLQRENKILAGRLSRLEKQRGSSGAAASTPWRPPPPPAAQRRDSSGQLSRHVSLEVLDSLCGILKTSDPLNLPSASRELQREAAAVPALRRFADDVCAVVFDEGATVVPWSMRNDDPEDVPAILRAWIRRLDQEGQAKRRIVKEVRMRCGAWWSW